MNIFFDLTKNSTQFSRLMNINSSNSNANSNGQHLNNNGSLILKAPALNQVLFFNEIDPENASPPTLSPLAYYQQELLRNNTPPLKSALTTTNGGEDSEQRVKKVKKRVTFPDDEKIIKDYSEPPKRGWMPGMYSTSDLLTAYLKSCDRHKCKPLNKLMPQLKALQDLDCANGEKVNVLNLKSERLDSKQIEALEEVFKRLSFKTIDLELSQFEDDTTAATLFEILEYYDTCEKLILSNNKTISLWGWQSIAKYIKKSTTLEYLDLRGHTFAEFIYFTYLARSIRLTLSLKVLHLENSNIQGRILLMLAAALKENEIVKEIYLGDNKMQPSDGQSICSIIKENKCLDILDLKNNNLQDTGLSHMCSGLSELGNIKFGLKGLYIANNNITSNGISYLSKALIHNRSLISLNISQNSLTNEAIYELKDALIVNKQISSLFLIKTKLTDEGVVALAEYIAETISLRRLDLRENDIRLGGLMALASSLKFNKTLSRLDLDREPKKEYSIRDSIETSRRLLKDISDFCMRNKREQLEYDAKQTELKLKQEEERKIKEIENEKKLVELFNELNEQLADSKASLNNTPNETYNDDESAKKCNLATERTEEDDECVDIINEDDELLKKILSRTTPSLHSPIKPNNDDLINYFNLVDKNYDEKLNKSNNLSNHSKENNYHRSSTNSADDEFQFIESDLNITPIKENELGLYVFRSTPSIHNPSNEISNNIEKNSNSEMQEKKLTENTDNKLVQSETSSLVKRQLFKENENNRHSENVTDTSATQILELMNHLVSIVVNNFSESNLNQNNFNSDDPNEVSFIAEQEPLSTVQTYQIEAKTQASKFDLKHKENFQETNSIEIALETSSTTEAIEVTSCEIKSSAVPIPNVSSPCDEEDSDIEVLTVSAKPVSFASKQQLSPIKNNIAIFGDSQSQTSTSKILINSFNNALLNSISEHEVNLLVNGNDNHNLTSELNEIAEEIESSALISNYDLITDDNSKENFCRNDSKPTFKSLVDYSINSNDDSSLNKSEESSIISNSNTKTPDNHKNKKQTTRLKSDQQKETTIFIQDSNRNASSSTSSVNRRDDNSINNVNTSIDYNTKPFFASKLTNSQLSEELSNEIGL